MCTFQRLRHGGKDRAALADHLQLVRALCAHQRTDAFARLARRLGINDVVHGLAQHGAQVFAADKCDRPLVGSHPFGQRLARLRERGGWRLDPGLACSDGHHVAGTGHIELRITAARNDGKRIAQLGHEVGEVDQFRIAATVTESGDCRHARGQTFPERSQARIELFLRQLLRLPVVMADQQR